MNLLKELEELKETIANEITEANKEIKKSGGDLNTGDIEMIDKLTHTIKSLATTCAMLEAEENGSYSNGYMPIYYGRDRAGDMRNGYSGNYGSYARNRDSRYSRENRGGYSHGTDWTEHLRMMLDEAPDESTRMDIKKLMDRMGNQ